MSGAEAEGWGSLPGGVLHNGLTQMSALMAQLFFLLLPLAEPRLPWREALLSYSQSMTFRGH